MTGVERAFIHPSSQKSWLAFNHAQTLVRLLVLPAVLGGFCLWPAGMVVRAEEEAEEPAAANSKEGGDEAASTEEATGDDGAAEAPAKKAAPASKKGASAALEGRDDTLKRLEGTPSVYWMLEFEPLQLRMISPREGVGAGQVYWYLIYDLINPAQESREVYVSITAASDNNKRYSNLFLPSVEKAIERKEGDSRLWGKVDEFAAISKRKPADPKYHFVTMGAGEKRHCVAIFNRLDPNANKITISVAGLSNEFQVLVREDGAKELEERVRELRYERAGDEYAPTLDSFKLQGKDWIKKKLPYPEGGKTSAR